jgi:leucyl aminopeptidase
LSRELHACFAPKGEKSAKPIWCVSTDTWSEIEKTLPQAARAFAADAGFRPSAGQFLLLPNEKGGSLGALFGCEAASARDVDPFLAGKLAGLLPEGVWEFKTPPRDAKLAALAFALGSYRFTRYRAGEKKNIRLVLPEGVDGADLSDIVDSVFLARDLINTPTNDLGPVELEIVAKKLAEDFGAKFESTVGDDLLKKNFPLIHAVGRASDSQPRLIDFRWGNSKDTKVTLVGKGVCFDTGGLDIKPSSAMLLMKKDMGGAAAALALASMIMRAKLKVSLRVLIPAVENSISDEAFRPGDIYKSRKGLTVEIGNTDAEGRLVLADTLSLADEEAPELLIDFATLTGAARVALGPELSPAYTDDDKLADDLSRFGLQENDPVWRMPLWKPYASMLDSKIADINNVSSGAFAGSITAALFLRRFVERAKSWLHLDIYAWNPSSKSGRPEGGEAMTARALFALLKERYSA